MHVNDILLREDIQEVRDRIDATLDKRSYPKGCWVWTGVTSPKGYGLARAGRKRRVPAHRLAYVLANGPMPLFTNGKLTCVLHHCDNPPCCNPEHLFLGSNRDNIDDMLTKGRSRKGEKHGRAKLTEETVRAILASAETDKALAAKFGVTSTNIIAIRQRTTWKHLTDSQGRPYPAVPLVGPKKGRLTPDDIRAIRADPRLHKEIAADFGVARNHVVNIKNGVRWGSVK
jgi:hypothetical protein